MRFPLSKLHRGFPELDAFTDAQCLGYVDDARRQFGAQVVLWRCGGLLLLPLGFVVAMVVAGSVNNTLREVWQDAYSPVPLFGGLVAVVGGWLLSGCAALLMRDEGLRRALRRRLEGARCVQCNYSLLGLAVADGNVRCPECGQVEHLADRGLSAAAILSPEATVEAPPA